MTIKILVGTVHSPTPGLESILEEFNKNLLLEPEGKDTLNRIMKAKTTIDKGFGQKDEAIQYSLTQCGVLNREAYYEAYVDYMGLTLHYCDKKNYDAGWFYYARASHCLGIYDAWDKVLSYLTIKDEERQNRVKGGRAKNKKHNELLVAAFLKIIKEKKPPGGWKNKKEVIDAALPTLEAVLLEHDSESFPLYENIKNSAYRWLKDMQVVFNAYSTRCAPTNKDWNEVLMDYEDMGPRNPKTS